ncbi:MAG: FAD-binding oxidoreductase [Pseudohongiella sp.]|nr:FAD-binding oxidoreductase [Pseudohongiella sp.]MDP2286303.1 FAD-binding oxidoreductase [Pseudohongiella sp.]
MVKVSSWGRLSQDKHHVISLSDRHQAARQIQQSNPGICFGNGRSYGDVCLNPGGTLWQTSTLNRFIHFDEQTGRLRCEAGVLLRDIQRTLVPRGWMLPVTPGTQLITVGGAIANDVHGKNHHVLGSFGDHVLSFRLLKTDGTVLECEPQSDLFKATIGGMGLTGILLDADLQLRPVKGPWLSTDTVPYHSLDAFFDLADQSEHDWEHTVSWIDCLSGSQARGIFLRANHADATPAGAKTPGHKQLNMPITPPISLVNRLSLRPFNELYYRLQARKAGAGFAHYEPFSYPLDALQNWNRMYGPRGFYQYQCVVPTADAKPAIAALLDSIRHAGAGSFLAVLKTFGDRLAPGLLSFPMPGATLALDFPNQGARTLKLFNTLDSIVRECGGRLYVAKDARMPADMFAAGYPNLPEFLKHRDPGISSAMSRRLFGS